MNERAGSSPPTSSTTMSTWPSASTRLASVVIGRRLMSRPPPGRVTSMSAAAARRSRQPARSSSIARSASSSFPPPAPTVPRPSNPMRTSFTSVRSTPEALQAAQRLTDALLVFHQREPHEAFPVLAEADSWGDRHLCLLDQELREFQRADGTEGLGDRGPDEHRAPRLLHRPPQLVQPVHEDVAAPAVNLHDVAHDARIALERHDPGDLDGLEGAVVEVRLDASERVHHLRVAAHEAEAPPRHVV